jgi:hypothetical protein
MENIVKLLAATAELMGSELSAPSLVVMAKDFAAYDLNLIEHALKNVRLNHTRFSPAAIQKEIEALHPDGRPGADEAWAMIPSNEYASIVWNDEIIAAYNICKPLVNEGDHVAARMAFKQAYDRLVAQNKMDGIFPKWQVSLGYSQEGREEAVKNAVQMRRITPEQAKILLPYKDNDNVGKAVALLQEKPLTEEQKERNRSKMEAIKEMLRNSSAGGN